MVTNINEQFIYIGTMPTKKETEDNNDSLFNTYFFMHYERDRVALPDDKIKAISTDIQKIPKEYSGVLEMSTQIYNLMIEEMMIGKNDKIVVFNLMQNTDIVISIIDHILFERVYYEEDLLKQNFISMMNDDSLVDTMIVSFNGEKYMLWETEFSFTEKNKLSYEDIKDKKTEIYESLTTKSIDYL